MKIRVPLAALVLLLGVGGLLAAWYVSATRALEAEVRLQNQMQTRSTLENERTIADRLARRLEELRASESQRPYFHYQNLYHDPKGASQGLSVVPSPLASGPGNPLIAAHFQIDARNRVSLPTLNDEDLSELNAANAPEQFPIRDTLAASAAALRAAVAPVAAGFERDVRIAQLEAKVQVPPSGRDRVRAERAGKLRLPAAQAEPRDTGDRHPARAGRDPHDRPRVAHAPHRRQSDAGRVARGANARRIVRTGLSDSRRRGRNGRRCRRPPRGRGDVDRRHRLARAACASRAALPGRRTRALPAHVRRSCVRPVARHRRRHLDAHARRAPGHRPRPFRRHGCARAAHPARVAAHLQRSDRRGAGCAQAGKVCARDRSARPSASAASSPTCSK